MFPERLKNLRKLHKLSQSALADKLNEKYDSHVSKSMISRWESGTDPQMSYVRIIADYFQVNPSALVDSPYNTTDELMDNSLNKNIMTSNSIIIETKDVMEQLVSNRQQIVYDCAKEQLDEQNHPNVHNIEESKQTYTIDVLGAVSAGTGEWLDGQQPEPVTVEGPLPHYDFAVRVNGVSMTPTFSDGEILFVDKVESASDVRNNQFVIAEINGNAYVKKLFVSNEGVRLISLNKDYEDIIIHDYDDYRIVGTVVI